jgi:hypothetical protein
MHIRDGRLGAPVAILSRISSARLKGTSRRLAALAYVREAARVNGASLDAETLPTVMEQLLSRVAPGSMEFELLAVLRIDIALVQIRRMVCSGNWSGAYQLLQTLPSTEGGDAAFLRAAVALGLQDEPIADVEGFLARALANDPSHEGLRVLLAEVRTFLRGADVGLATLTSPGTAPPGRLTGQALASTYRVARRGLEAKRLGFAEFRRSGTVPADVRAVLEEVIRFEVPTKPTGPVRARVSRAPVGSLLTDDGLPTRAHLLLSYAFSASQRTPALRDALEEASQCLKRALLLDDLAEGRKAEQKIVELMGRVVT